MSDYEKAIRIRNASIVFVAILFLMLTRPSFHHISSIEKHAKGMQTSQLTNATQPMGVDVSHYQGRIEWKKVAAADTKFAFVKATEGTTYIDPLYAANIEGLKEVAIPYGSYHFFHPSEDAAKQANHFLENTGEHHSLPPVLDIETTDSVTNEIIISGARTWLRIVKTKTGCTPILYTSTAFWNKYLNEKFAGYPLWIADYSDKLTLPDDVENWLFWQKTPDARVSGISISVDQNHFSGTEKELHKIKCGNRK